MKTHSGKNGRDVPNEEDQITKNLKIVYDEILTEPLSDKLARLLDNLKRINQTREGRK